MNQLEYVYIAREVLVSGRGSIRIDEEGVFSSFEEASAFLESLREDDIQQDPLFANSNFMHEIVKYHINDYENWNTDIKWIFKSNGELIEKIDSNNLIFNTFESVPYQSLYKLGEIVKVKSYFEEPMSHLIRENFGVIGHVPALKKNWQESRKPLKDWDGTYIIWLISQDTHLLYHEHIYEPGIENFSGKLPEDLFFLKLASDYLRSDGDIPDAENVKKVFHENIVVRKFNYFYDNSR